MMQFSQVGELLPLWINDGRSFTVHATRMVTIDADVYNTQAVKPAITLVPGQSSIHIVSPCHEHLHIPMHIRFYALQVVPGTWLLEFTPRKTDSYIRSCKAERVGRGLSGSSAERIWYK